MLFRFLELSAETDLCLDCSGPLIVMFVVDGQFCDGGGIASEGWSWIHPFKDLNGAKKAQIAPSYGGELKEGRLYDRSLRVSEAVASYRAALGNRTADVVAR